MEGKIEAFEAGDLVGALSTETGLHGQVEEDGEVGHEPIGGDGFQCPEPIERDAGAIALVGQRRIGVSSADDRPTALECRAKDLRHELSTGGIEEQGIRQRVGRDCGTPAREEQIANPFADLGATWFAGQQHVDAAPTEVIGKRLGLRRLAGAIRPFDRDEPASTRGRPGFLHAGSVSDELSSNAQ